ncbi:MAG TPA: hypothetical protein VFX58_20675 [Chitinophagaceae bacterium]|nr:hypothetical protein [Chitinophagaceae bacterium]
MKHLFSFLLVGLTLSSCDKDPDNSPRAKDINTAEKVAVDRFSSAAGKLFVRDATNGLPTANAPINFDQVPFITKGLTANGAPTEYYNFDVQSLAPANIYEFYKNGATAPLPGQNNIIPTIPGDAGYNDFWVINKVTVPDNYVPNSITSEAEVLSSGFNIQKTSKIVNCPVVPFGSVASKKYGGGSQALAFGWYKGKAVAYFSFVEKDLAVTANGNVPIAPIYVMFNDNTAGPASGFKTEPGTEQTHNVLAVSPSDAAYSPLWSVIVIDNSSFNNVMNLSTAQSAPVLNPGGGFVNCPVVQ